MLVGSAVRRVAIVGGRVFPFARSMGAYAECSEQDMLTAAPKGVVNRFRVAGERLGDVIGGAGPKALAGLHLLPGIGARSGLRTRNTGLRYPTRVPVTSLEAAILIGTKIALENIDSGIACGVDSASDVPVVYPIRIASCCCEARRRSAMERIKPWFGLRPKHFVPTLPGVVEPRTGSIDGQSCEQMVTVWQIARQAKDQLAFESHFARGRSVRAGFIRI